METDGESNVFVFVCVSSYFMEVEHVSGFACITNLSSVQINATGCCHCNYGTHTHKHTQRKYTNQILITSWIKIAKNGCSVIWVIWFAIGNRQTPGVLYCILYRYGDNHVPNRGYLFYSIAFGCLCVHLYLLNFVSCKVPSQKFICEIN